MTSDSEKKIIPYVRWTARIIGTITVLVLLVIIVAFLHENGFNFSSDLFMKEKIGLIGPLLLIIGLIAAWKWEGIGALMIIVGYLMISLIVPVKYIVVILGASHPLLILGLMYGWCWLKSKNHNSQLI